MNDTENENKTATEAELKALAEAYLDAFHKRDLERCVEFFSDDAAIDFNMTAYKGRQAIIDWHKDRFEADLKMLRLNNISVKGDTVTVDGVATSKRLVAWKAKSIAGRVTMRFADGKIKSGKLSARMTNPLNMLREDMGTW
ncbi:MAG TPA: nuclear transport factor 2 family protein [Bryobacteraceae bacterium]|jgi:ketosteroid isomerase-like protein|nr:nuclear transport factor 2 family protein [Bryobacteraceae bacterium]